MRAKNITTQKLSVSQKTITASTVLQCSTEELYDYLEQQALENPVIDIEQQASHKPVSAEQKAIGRETNREKYIGSNRPDDSDFSNPLWDMQKKREFDLSQYLLFQLLPLHLSASQSKIAHYIAYSLNSEGFFDIKIEEAASSCAVEIADIYEVLEMMWQLDPPGVCAYDVRHALCIQVDRLKADPLAKIIINKHLQNVAKDKAGSVARELKQPTKRVAACFELIKTLDPHPCRAFTRHDNASYIFPDITVSLTEEGICYSLSDHFSPRIFINKYYRDLRNSSDDPTLNAYLDERISKAQYLQQCIMNRQTTTEQIAGIIIQHQQDFFIFGPGHLSPITMAEASKKLGVHESTVSRAVRGKYLQCSHGLFPLSHFFPGTVSSANAIPVSKDLITALIKDFVSKEDKMHPLNDRVIADLLEDRGISISRRTVAKYRDAMGIASSSARCIKSK